MCVCVFLCVSVAIFPRSRTGKRRRVVSASSLIPSASCVNVPRPGNQGCKERVIVAKGPAGGPVGANKTEEVVRVFFVSLSDITEKRNQKRYPLPSSSRLIRVHVCRRVLHPSSRLSIPRCHALGGINYTDIGYIDLLIYPTYSTLTGLQSILCETGFVLAIPSPPFGLCFLCLTPDLVLARAGSCWSSRNHLAVLLGYSPLERYLLSEGSRARGRGP